ncbi:DNA mismatch repair protein MutH [Bifidobacterium sp. LC6]|uniref:DNA mismatch repair protein MutH n=1 Tax=Bifidobacterium colobi TaxID=2809026 RepID=A0ABS5UV22_9BIFI|nr:Sau3AI family type II restriction endonuclease [Bifidobacterium colobi]MBT1174283.1 DNA mismatch repair protein MutH [Bifidobacterium colobi]
MSDKHFNETRSYSSLEEVMNTLHTAQGKSFRELDQTGRALTGGNKGSLGQIIEESVLKYAINSDAEPDIRIGNTSYELKVTPLKHIKNGKQISAKERLVIDIINYMTLAAETDFESSKMWAKARNIILVYYFDDRTNKKKELRIDCRVLAAFLMTYGADDLATIKNDWQIIRDKVASGHADSLSESDTNYLAACTKGANSKQLRKAPAPSGSPTATIFAKQRAFSLKASYMTAVARRLLNIKSDTVRLPMSKTQILDEYIVSRIAPYVGQSGKAIAAALQVATLPSAKNYNSNLVFAMLGAPKSSIQKIEQFSKAGISQFKAVTVYPNGLPKEHMSFPAITDEQWAEWADPESTWEDSFVREFFETTKFLIMVTKSPVPYKAGHDRAKDIFSGSFLWNMPEADIEQYVKPVWETMHRLLVEHTPLHYGVRGKNLIPGQSFNKVFHLRPHASKGKDNGTENDRTILPTGEIITKQCFWLDRRYIAKIIKEHDLLK